jgi:hypothetical protein
MEKADFAGKKIEFEHEISYSQDAVSNNFILGILSLLTGIALAYSLNRVVAILLALLGFLLIWKAIKQIRSRGPQLKIGRAGIWTVKTGFLPWDKIQAHIKSEAGFRTVPIYLIMLDRSDSIVEIGRLPIAELDIKVLTLQTYLNKYSPKQT